MELYSSVHRVYEHSVDSRVFTAERCVALRGVTSCTPSMQGATTLPRMCTLPA